MNVKEYNERVSLIPHTTAFFEVRSVPRHLMEVIKVGDLIYASPTTHQLKYTLDGRESFAIGCEHIEFAGYHVIEVARQRYGK